MMAAAEALNVTVTGRGGHGSQPHHAADPIPVACEIVTALQVLVTRRFDIFDPVVITVGSFHAGTTNNVIPDEARLEVTIRSFSPESRALVRESAVRVVHEIAAAHGLTATAEFTGSYPVTVNDEAEAQFADRRGDGLPRRGPVHPQANPMAGAEDFSYVLEQVPGAFIMLGACPPASIRPRPRSTTPRSPCSTTWCWPTARPCSPNWPCAASAAVRACPKGWRPWPAFRAPPRPLRAARRVPARSGRGPRPGGRPSRRARPRRPGRRRRCRTRRRPTRTPA